MSAPIVYRSTDASAPVLTGVAGSLITVLNAVLVNGYGTQAAAGWTSPFTGTNGAVYRMLGGNRFYLTINDNGPGAAGGQEARMWGNEVVTSYSATGAGGTGLFPTAAQVVNGLKIRKSSVANGTAIPWVAVADDRTLYFFCQSGDAAGAYRGWMFGDFYSLLSGDGYRTMIVGQEVENSGTTANDALHLISALTSSTTVGHYVPRSYTGTGSALNETVVMDNSLGTGVSTIGAYGSNGIGPSSLSYPNAVDGGVYANRIRIFDNTNTFRGWLRGFYSFENQNTNLVDGDTFTGASSGDFNGRTFLIVKGSAGGLGVYLVETSNTWDTSS